MDWFIIYTKSRYEKKVEQTLSSLGFEAYCPKRKYPKKWSDRKKNVEEVLFKSYLFVKIEPSQKNQILNLNGVVKFVNFKGEHATIRDAEINKIKAMLNDFDNESIIIQAIQPGDLIEIKSGVLMGASAQVLQTQGKKAQIFIEALGMKLEIDLTKTLI